MKIIKRDLGSEVEEFILVPLGDWHIGNKDCRLDTIQKKIEYVKNTPNAYCTVGGDLLECIIKESKGDIFTQELTPQKQLDKAVELLQPIKNKILGIVSGNHEARIYKDTGFDVSRDMAKHLGLEDLYDAVDELIFVSFGKNQSREKKRHTKSIYLNHELYNATTIQSCVLALQKLSSVVWADIYVGQHTHFPIVYITSYLEAQARSKTIIKRMRAFMNGGSDMDYPDYARQKCFEPKPIALVTLTCKVIHTHTQDYIQMSDQKIYY
jgi:hypothetical protein